MTPRTLRVVFVAHRFFPHTGGTESHMYEVGRRLAAAGVRITVLTTDPSHTLPSRETIDHIDVIRVGTWPRRGDLLFAPDLPRTLRAARPNVVHCQGVHTLVGPLAMVTALQRGLPYVVTFHSGGHSSRARNLFRPAQWQLMRPLLTRAERLIAVSRFEARHFAHALRLPNERVAVVPNGADISMIRGSDNPLRSAGDGNLIVSVGRLERYKGHHHVLRALPLVRRVRPGMRLLILGAGPFERSLRRMAAELGCADVVEIRAIPPGARSEMAEALCRAAVVTALSEYESQGIAALEAAALGRPLVVARTSALEELVEQGIARGVSAVDAETVAAAILAQLTEPLIPTRIQLPTWDEAASALLKTYRSVEQRTHDGVNE